MIDIQDCYHEPLVSERIDRIRAIFELPYGESLPRINSAAMFRYYRYLLSQISLPFEVCYSPHNNDTICQATVTSLVDPQIMPSDNRAGLCCLAQHRGNTDILPLVDIEVEDGTPNFHLLEDYWFWFWNWHEEYSHRATMPR